MNHYTATDLIPSWYENGVKKDVPAEEMTIRRSAIDEIVSNDDYAFWLSCLKVYLNKSHFGDKDYDTMVNLAREGDENFNIQNDNLIKIICGCAIGQKMDEFDSVSDFLFLAMTSTEVVPSMTSVIPELRDRAKYGWLKSSEESRQVNTEFTIGNGNLKSSVKVEIPEIIDATSYKPHSDAIVKTITAIQKELITTSSEVNTIHNALQAIKTNFISLSEETNILWWLFGGYSTILKKPFKSISPELLSIIIAIELSNLTKILPGIGGVKSMINRAFSNVNYEEGSSHSFESVIDSIATNEEVLKTSLPDHFDELIQFTPFLYGIRCRTDYAGNEWKPIYKKQIDIEFESKFTYEFFTFQLYIELMLVEQFKLTDE